MGLMNFNRDFLLIGNFKKRGFTTEIGTRKGTYINHYFVSNRVFKYEYTTEFRLRNSCNNLPIFQQLVGRLIMGLLINIL